MSQALPLNLITFGRVLRAAGLPVTPDQTRLFAKSLLRLGPDRRGDVKAAGRVIYARGRDEAGIFDRAFDLFWRRTVESEPSILLPRLQSHRSPQGAPDAPGSAGSDAVMELPPAPRGLAASAVERLRQRDFAELTPEEARDATRMISALAPRLPFRPSRRHRPTSRGRRLALRSMMRRSLSSGGESLDWRWYGRTTRPRPLVLILDVSGSMETYSRFLLRFAHALRCTGAPVEVFVFGTRLTRITRELRHRDPDQALRRVAAAVRDWNGGTRIGASLHALNRQWVRRAVRSSAVVLIASDGWERDDPVRLGREMELLRRSCHHLLWLNPLAGHPGFTPATGGMRAALPHVDRLVPCGTVASLEQLARQLGTLVRDEGTRRRNSA